MKTQNHTAAELAAKTKEQLIEITDSLELQTQEDFDKNDIINLILDFQEAPESKKEDMKLLNHMDDTYWYDEDEEVVFAKMTLRPVTQEEALALKMKRLALLEKEANKEKDIKVRIIKETLNIKSVMKERQEYLNSVASLMELEGCLTH